MMMNGCIYAYIYFGDFNTNRKSAYRTSCWSSIVILVLSYRTSKILALLCAESHFYRTPTVIAAKISGVPLEWGLQRANTAS